MKKISILLIMILISYLNPACVHRNRDSNLDEQCMSEQNDKESKDSASIIIEGGQKYNTDTMFRSITTLKIHDNSKYQWTRIKEKVENDYSIISGNFRNEIVTILNLSPQQEIVPIGKIRVGNMEVLFVEIFIRKFPIMFSDVFGLLYSIDNGNILDSIHLYSDKDVGIKDCLGFFFEWDSDKGRIFSRSCDDLEDISISTVTISNSRFLVEKINRNNSLIINQK